MEKESNLFSLVLSVLIASALIGLFGCATAPGREAATPIVSVLEEGQPPSGEPPSEEQPPDEGPPVEVQITLTADRTNLQPGECSTLQWNVQGGEVAHLNGQPVDLSGQMEVCPQETTTYSLAVYVGVGPPALPKAEREVVISVESTGQPPTSPAATSVPPAATHVTVLRDLEYARYELGGQEHALLLDLYLPEQSTPKPFPLLIYIHGGGWIEGSKDNCPGATFAQRGYTMACVSYRLPDLTGGCPQARSFPAQIHDVKAAVRWLRGHAEEYGLDPERFGAMGDSSGGHLAALLGTSHKVAGLEGSANLGVSDAVQAVCDWYGPIDVTQSPPMIVFEDDPCQLGLDYLNATYGGEETPYFYWTLAWGTFLGGSLADPVVLERAAQAIPLTYVDAGDPPFLVIHGEADGMVPIAQSELLVAALKEAGVEVTFVRLPGVGHSFSGSPGLDQEVDPAFLEPTLEFFDRHLKAPPLGEATPEVISAPSELTWVRLGGPPGGLGYDIRYNFDDPNTWYVTDNFAGVHISNDNGLTWQPSNTGIPPQLGPSGDWIPIFCLTVDPHNPQTVWAGTDKTGHIYKSTDGGRAWSQMDNGVDDFLEGVTFRGFNVDPRSSDIVYAAGEVGSPGWAGEDRPGREFDMVQGFVYKTTDGGQNWDLIWNGNNLARYVWIDPRDPNVIYVSTGIFDREAANSVPDSRMPGGVGVVKSTDGGQTWQEITNGLNNLYVGTLFMHPDDPDILLAGTGNNQYHEATGVYRTTDGGETWTHVLDTSQAEGGEVITSVELCPSDPNIGYAGGASTVYRTENAGQTWELVSGGVAGWGPSGVMAGWPIDMQCDVYDPNRVFANNYNGGNFLSEDGGRTWQNASDGYTGAQMRSVTVEPHDPARAYAAGRSGLWRTDDGGASWNGLYYPPADFGIFGLEWQAVGLDPSQPGHLLAVNIVSTVIMESEDGGLSWQVRWSLDRIHDELPAGIESQVPGAIVFAPSHPTTVYMGLCFDVCVMGHEPICDLPGVGVIVSHDGGASWERAVGDYLRDVCVINLAVGPTNAQTVYAAAATGLFKTADGGSTWTPLTGFPAGQVVRTVAVSPDDPQHVLVGVEGIGVYVSTDGGGTWQEGVAGLEANGSLHDIVFDPTNTQVVYTSDYLSGVYRSTDGGLTWTQINDGLRARSAMGLSISADGQHLYVATNGEGIYRLDLSGEPPQPVPGVTPAIPSTPPPVAAAPTSTLPPTQPTVPPEATPTPTSEASEGRGICGGVAAIPLALAGLVWVRRRRS